jgi:predicted ATPase
LGDELRVGWACSGLSGFHNTHGQVERGLEFAERVLAIAERVADDDLALRGRIDAAVVETYRGRFAPALAHLERALTHYDPERSYLLDSGFSINHPGVLLGYQTAWNLVFLGRPDQGVERARENVATARRIGHPFSIAAALAMETVVHAMRRDTRRLRERAEETIEFSEANGFPFWLRVARSLHACARVLGGEHDAVDDLVQSVRESAGNGSLAGATALLSLVADACLCAGKLGEARGQVELGLALAARTGEHMVDAEFHRLTAEIGLAEGAAPGDAEASFVHSLEIARGQQAKGMELRTATGLARLWRDQGRQGEAKRLLAPCYEAFSEGFDTADLREAKALRDEL